MFKWILRAENNALFIDMGKYFIIFSN